AIDVLQNVPMLSVDLDGNVSMRGSSNIRVLINNKPSTIMASSVPDAIRQIPADQIKSVEVITSPSAKYDAEGTAGIINIITKKNNLQGISGSVNASGGNRSSSLNGNINFRKKKWGIGVNTGGYTYYPLNNSTTDRINTDEEGNVQSVLDQFDEGRTFGIFNNTRLNFDYDFNPKTYISAGARFGVRYNDTDSELSSRLTDPDNQVIRFFNADIENTNRFNTVDFNLDYVKRFEKQGQEFSILGLYSRDFGGNDYTRDQSDSTGTINNREENFNDNFNEEITIQTDYAHPLMEGSLLEVGAKAILRTVNSDFQLFIFDFDQNEFVNIPELSNVFNYTQDVYSGYVSTSYTTKFKLAIKAGVRYERTAIVGDFVSDDTRFTQNYDNFVPSIVLSQELKKGMKLKLSYNRRIQRPSIFFLNPFENRANPLNVRFGNPNLDPELTNNYEMSYNVFFKRNSITTSVYWR
ncbi:MAG: TonB-dependent receptor, partial [Bacteroidota bacterium]